MRKTAAKRRPPVPLAVQLLAPPSASTPSTPSALATASKLPPLFPTPTPALAALHERVYHFVALVLRAYVQQWYVRLSPRDAEVLPAINGAVLVPVLGPLLAGLQRAALAEFLLLHAPAIALLHVRTLRAAQAAPRAWAGALGDAYHAQLPLRSVARGDGDAGDWAVSAEYYTALFGALHAHALPHPGGGARVERAIVAEVLANSVLGNVSRRVTRPWFWAQTLARLLSRPAAAEGKASPRSLRSLHAALTRARRRLLALFDLWRSAPPPERKYTHLLPAYAALLREVAQPAGIPARIAFFVLGLFALILSPVADRLLPLLLIRALDPTLGMRLLDLLERAVFPCDGYPSPEEFVEPSPELQALLWAQLRYGVREKAPWMRFVVGGEDWVDTLLDPLAHAGPNAHLAAMLYDGAIATLAPDLADE